MSYGIGPPPVITTQPQPQSTCSGNSVTFTAAATTTFGTLTYQWRRGGSNISGATSTSYTTGTAGSYDCVTTNPWGSTTTNAATLTVNAATAISGQPATQRVAYGGTGTFSVVASGTSISYQWRRNSVVIPGATALNYTTGNPGSYDCVVTGSCGTVTSNASPLLINNANWVSSVAAAKQLTDGTVVGLSQGPNVTRSLSGFYYVEDYNRVAGIRVIANGSANMLSEKGVATIYGIIQNYNGERVINGGLISGGGSGMQPQPVGVTCAAALSRLAQGLYVRMAGTVSDPQSLTNTFVLNDGSGYVIVRTLRRLTAGGWSEGQRPWSARPGTIRPGAAGEQDGRPLVTP